MKRTRISSTILLATFGLILAMPAAMAAQPQRPENVMKVLKANKDFSKFADMVSAAGLESEFSNKEGRLTVFAPTNAAMEKLPSDVVKRAKDSKDGLKTLVNYHVVKGSMVFQTNIKGRRAGPSTASGEMIGFDGTGKDLKVNDAVIVLADQASLNGVVHGLNAVLIPESLKDPKIKEAARLKEEQAMKAEMEAREAERAEEMKKTESAAPVKAAPSPAAASAPVVDKTTEEKLEEPAAPVAVPVVAPAADESTPAVAPAPEPAPIPAPKEEKKGFLKKLFGK